MSQSTLHCLACGDVMGSGTICAKCGWTYAPDTLPNDSLESTDVESSPISESNSLPDAGPPTSTLASHLPKLPQRSDAELWLEVVAVLAVAVIPHIVNAAWYYVFDPTGIGRVRMYEFADRFLRSACVAYVVMYLIYRSGDPWKMFGLTAFKASDVFLGVMLLSATNVVSFSTTAYIPESWFFAATKHATEISALEFFVLVASDCANGFAEEIVCRGYLITRFEQLVKSRLWAIIIASFLFASYHLGWGPGQFVYAFVFGILYSGAFLLFRSLSPLVISHACSNILLELSS